VRQSDININVLLTAIGESFDLKYFEVCLFCVEGYIKNRTFCKYGSGLLEPGSQLENSFKLAKFP
jgi:hypothetical protein